MKEKKKLEAERLAWKRGNAVVSACCMGIGALKRLGRGLVRTVVLKALVDAKAVFGGGMREK